MDGREPAPDTASLQSPQLRTLLVCDIADSTALVENLGDSRSAQLVRKHDRLARALLDQHGGREIDKTDGFLLLFERPIHAVAFALDYQRGLRHLSAAEGVALRARVGIHVGDVMVWENSPEDVARGAKPIEVEGFAKPVAARIAELALPTQVLLSGTAAALAQRAQGELDGAHGRVRWRQHGRYRFKGAAEAVEIVEVGEEGLAPLRAPPAGRNARREVPWWRRPAALAAEAVLLALAIGAGGWVATRSRPALAFAARDWVVVAGVDNRSGLPRLDDALDSAMRVGLSQSQYVNVMPDMEMQDTLKRMRQPPDARVGRRLGIEIAQRQGARAVIVPTLTAVGGRIQVAAEVVNPQNGATVYSDAATARDANQLLPATDRVLAAVRRNLGESLASIGRTAAPLADITTSNLDALRAYALAEQSIGRGDIHATFLLLNQAIHLDPHFSMALARRATLELAFMGDRVAAYKDLQAALEQKNRLSLRERLAIEGTISFFFEGQQQALDRWSLLAKLYPDFTAAQQNLGLLALWYMHRPDLAAKHFSAVAASRNPQRGVSWYGLALAQTEMGDQVSAQRAVTQGRALGTIAPGMEDVIPDLVAGNDASVIKRLDSLPSTLPPHIQAAMALMRASVSVARGEDAEAQAHLARAAIAARQGRDATQQAYIRLAQIAVHFAGHDPTAPAALNHFVSEQTAQLAGGPIAVNGTTIIVLARAAMLASDHGLDDLATKAVAATAADAARGGYYSRQSLWRTARCLANAVQPIAERITCLKALVDGHEYAETHIALMHLYSKSGRQSAARSEARWLLEHRGVALAELDSQPTLIPNLLVLRAAALIADIPSGPVTSGHGH